MNGNRLKELLAAKEIKQIEVATALGISGQAMYHMFSNKDIKTGVLETICKEFGIDMNYFYPEICISSEQYEAQLEYLRQLIKLKDGRIAQLEDELALAKAEKIG